MNRERAETHLRLLAEDDLRRAAAARGSRWDSARLYLVAEALRAVGAIGVGTVDRIRQDQDLALTVRRPGPRGLTQDARMHLVSVMHHPPPRSAGGGFAVPFFGAAHDPRGNRLVPVDRVIQVTDAAFPGELYLLAFAQTPHGGRFLIAWRYRSPASAGPFRSFTATDDQGTRYRLGFRAWGGTDRTESEGALDLRPDPPPGIRWLDVSAAPGEPATRIDLNPPASSDPSCPAGPPVVLAEAAASPGELLLNGIAARILARAEPGPGGTVPAAGVRLRSFPHAADGFGDIVAALRAAEALSPLSPVPGQLARLCASLGITGHGITAPPAADLPEPWQAMLTDDRPAPGAPAPPGTWAAVTVELPELDGARMAILGLHHGERDTTLNVQASGVELEDDWLYIRGVRPMPVLWIRDHRNRWHTVRSAGLIPQHDHGAVMLRLAIVPPLDPGTPRIDVIASAASGEARVTLPLRWR